MGTGVGEKIIGRICDGIASVFMAIFMAVFMTVFMVMPLPAAATDIGWQAGIGGDVRWFDWREYQKGNQLLVESGPLGALIGDVGLNYGPAYVSAELLWGGGLAQYDGRLQAPQNTPYSADAWERIADSQLRLGWRAQRWDVHAGLMQRDWHRNIDGNAAANVSSAEERYRWRLATIGGEMTVFSTAEWQVAVAADVGRPIDSFQKVYGRVFDAFEVEPGDGRYWRIALPLRRHGETQTLTIEPYFQYQDMDPSNYVPAYMNGQRVTLNGHAISLFQPESERREFGLALRWAFSGTFKK